MGAPPWLLRPPQEHPRDPQGNPTRPGDNPQGTPRDPQRPPKDPRGSPKDPQGTPKGPQGLPRIPHAPPRAPREPPKGSHGLFWDLLGSLWAPPGPLKTILDPLLIPYWRLWSKCRAFRKPSPPPFQPRASLDPHSSIGSGPAECANKMKLQTVKTRNPGARAPDAPCMYIMRARTPRAPPRILLGLKTYRDNSRTLEKTRRSA